MAVVQSTYAAKPAIGVAGMVANGETSNRISRTVEDAAGIAFGRPAFRGTGDHGVTLVPTANALMGIVIADKSVTPVPGGVAADIVPQYGTAALMTIGSIFVDCATAVADGAQLYATASTGVITATASGNVILPGWFADDTIAAPGLVRAVRR